MGSIGPTERANRRDSQRERSLQLESSRSFAYDDRLRFDKWGIFVSTLRVPRFTFVLTLVLYATLPSRICAQCGLMPVVPTTAPSMGNYGAGVAVDGDTLVVAKRQFAAGDSGTVYIFDRTETGWEYAQELASPVGQYDRFGYSIAVSADYLVVGAPYSRVSSSSGKAYVYKRGPSEWTLCATLAATFGDPPDGFGESVDIDGDYIVVGAPCYSGWHGRVWVFHREENTWTHQDSFSPWSAYPHYYAGQSVAISGDWVVFGVPKASLPDPPYTDNAGVVYMAHRIDTQWGVSHRLTRNTASANDQFGYAVAIDGNVALIGTPYNSSSVAMYEYDGEDWILMGGVVRLDRQPGDRYGSSIAIDGDLAAVGAYGRDDTGAQSGAAYIFRRFNPYMWTQEAKIVIPGSGDWTMLGFSVDLTSTEAVVGAPAFASPDPGAAYVVPTDALGHGDFDVDGLIGSGDYTEFHACFLGPAGNGVEPECACADFDADGYIDLADVAGLQVNYTSAP